MWIIIGIGMPNVLLFISYREGRPLRKQKSFKFNLNKSLKDLVYPYFMR